MPVVNKGLLIRAILFTLILSIGPIAEMARFSGNSYRTLNDIDEGFYLGVTMQAGRVPLSALVRDGLFDPKDSILVMPPIPQLVSDHLLGALARIANLNGAELGLILDLICPFLSYLAFYFLFSQLTSNKVHAELAAFAFLALPWLADIDKIPGPPASVGNWVLRLPAGWPMPPVLRAVSTQISYPLIGLSLGLLLKVIRSAGGRKTWAAAAAAGAAGGFVIYQYTFGWIAGLAISAALLAAQSLFGAGLSMRRLLPVAALFYFGNLAAASFGILMLHGMNYEITFLPAELKQFFYLPVFKLVLAAGLVIVSWALSCSNPLPKKIAVLWGLAAAAEAALVNLQPILGRHICAYHFPAFYTGPFLSGLFVLWLFELIASFNGSRQMINLAKVSAVAGLVIGGGKIPLRTAADIFDAVPDYVSEYAELGAKLRQFENKSASIVYMVYQAPFQELPELELHEIPLASLQAIAPEHFTALVRSIADRSRSIISEMYLGTLFSGSPRMVRFCPAAAPELPGDTFAGIKTWAQLMRISHCAEAKLLEQHGACWFIGQLHADYLLWQTDAGLKLPQWVDQAAEESWTSSRGKYKLYRIDEERLKQYFCSRN